MKPTPASLLGLSCLVAATLPAFRVLCGRWPWEGRSLTGEEEDRLWNRMRIVPRGPGQSVPAGTLIDSTMATANASIDGILGTFRHADLRRGGWTFYFGEAEGTG